MVRIIEGVVMQVTHLLTAMRGLGIRQIALCAEERGRSVKDCWDLRHNNTIQVMLRPFQTTNSGLGANYCNYLF